MTVNIGSLNWLGHTCRKYFAAGSKIGILAIFQFGFESFTIVKSTKIKDFEQISVCLVILQVQIWRTVALSTGMLCLAPNSAKLSRMGGFHPNTGNWHR